MHLRGQAFGLAQVAHEFRERESEHGAGVDAPEVGDLEEAVFQRLYASPLPCPKKPITAPCTADQSGSASDSMVDMGTAAKREA